MRLNGVKNNKEFLHSGVKIFGLYALLSSFRKMFIGFMIAIVLGVILGLLLTRHRFFPRRSDPWFLGCKPCRVSALCPSPCFGLA